MRKPRPFRIIDGGRSGAAVLKLEGATADLQDSLPRLLSAIGAPAADLTTEGSGRVWRSASQHARAEVSVTTAEGLPGIASASGRGIKLSFISLRSFDEHALERALSLALVAQPEARLHTILRDPAARAWLSSCTDERAIANHQAADCARLLASEDIAAGIVIGEEPTVEVLIAMIVGRYGLGPFVARTGVSANGFLASALTDDGQGSIGATLRALIDALLHLGQVRAACLLHNALLKTLEDRFCTDGMPSASPCALQVSERRFISEMIDRIGHAPRQLEPRAYEGAETDAQARPALTLVG
ncbi:hypothetical protein [Parvularcula lutaonensis]|uniref:Uncharacterized protein n=1 Tax=Parvularcula lutaonensis TaxID=491923 RepID=A0ABV7M7M4_9PROT|nr:hypothetical protein [Parvularcula lutaonensis]GGY56828.1 hypothetical protein GCM10007148_27930 [Parvularcula lutaonensis]